LNAIYQGDSRLRGFPCWDRRHSVEDKLYHLGFRGKVARSTLADANESHDWRIFADFAQVLIRIARPLYATTKLASISIKVCTLWIRRPSICVDRDSSWRLGTDGCDHARRPTSHEPWQKVCCM